jgi:carbamoyltransferase
MKVLGINLSHNASFSIVEKGHLLFSLEQERISKKKKDSEINLLCSNLNGSHFPIIGYTSYDLTDEKLTYLTNKLKYDLTKENITYDKLIPYDRHHLTHCYSSFYNSDFKDAICLIIDNGGTSYTLDGVSLGQELISIYKLSYDKEPELIYKLCINRFGKNFSMGKYHSYNCMSPAGIFQTYKHVLNLKEEGSIMGLSSYGKDNKEVTNIYDKSDLFCKVNINFNDFIIRRIRVPDEDFCYRIQKESTEIVKKYIDLIMKDYGNNICLSGGFFQNSVANYEFLKMNSNIFVDPVCHDGGTSIGLAHHLDYIINKNKPIKYANLYQGPIYNNKNKLLNSNILSEEKIKIIDCDNKKVAQLLKDNKCVGIYQGRSEMGPRALGNRSILFNPINANAKDKVNLVKKREWFRPYAGTVLFEHTKDWFNLEGKDETPFMSYVVDVNKNKINKIPGICHVDNTCRIQTLKKEHNKNFYEIIDEFYKITGVPVILNTSLNQAGKPLIESIENCFDMILESKIDFIYFPEYKQAIESV